MVVAIAHRAPATAEGCARLLELGVTVFEVDVQVIGGELTVSHYLPVRGLPGVRRDRWSVTVARRRAAEVALASAVSVIPAAATVLLDLKIDRGEPALALARAVASAGLDKRRCHVSSKGWASLEVLRKAGFRTWRSVADAPMLAAAIRHGKVQDHAYTVRHTLLNPEILKALQNLAPRVFAWTVNEPKRALKLCDFGVDGVTSDNPQVLELVAALRK